MLSYTLHYSYLSVKQFLSSVNRSALLGFDESKNDLLQSERMEATKQKHIVQMTVYTCIQILRYRQNYYVLTHLYISSKRKGRNR